MKNQEIILAGKAMLNAQISDQERSIPYRPHYTRITGSPVASILLQQISFWWQKNGRKPFYKFKMACNHDRYHPGDSWCEELEISRGTFDRALKRFAAKVTSGDSKSELLRDHVVIYWTDSNRLTWYQVNEDLLAAYVYLAYHDPDLLGKVQNALYLDNAGNALYLDNVGNALYLGNDQNAPYLSSEITSEITSEMNSEIDHAAGAADDDEPDFSFDLIDLIPRFSERDRQTFLKRYPPADAVQWYCYVLDPANGIKNPAGYLHRCCIKQREHPPGYYAPHEVQELVRRLSRVETNLPNPPAAYSPLSNAPPTEPGDPERQEPPSTTVVRAPSSDAPDPESNQLWQQALAELELQMTRSTFSTWLQPTRLLAWDEGRITIGAPNTYIKEWLENRLIAPIRRTLSGIANCPLTVEFVVLEEVTAPIS